MKADPLDGALFALESGTKKILEMTREELLEVIRWLIADRSLRKESARRVAALLREGEPLEKSRRRERNVDLTEIEP